MCTCITLNIFIYTNQSCVSKLFLLAVLLPVQENLHNSVCYLLFNKSI